MAIAPILSGLGRDLRFAGRLIARRPGPALLSAGTIALGVGAVSLMASITWSILLQPLPYPDSHRLVQVTETREGGTSRFGPLVTNATWLAWREAARTIDGIGAYSSSTSTMSAGTQAGSAERVAVTAMTASLAPLIGARPSAGRLFTADDERRGAPLVVLISDELWTRQFSRRGDIVGRTLRLDGETHIVVGVMAPGIHLPDRRTLLWTPYRVPAVVEPGVEGHQLALFRALARLKPGITVAQAAAEATVRARTAPDPGPVVMAVFGSLGPAVVSVEPALDALTRDVRPGLLVLLAAVVLLLVCAVANVANLQLAGAASRRREMGIRAAIGAPVSRLVRQLVVEHLVSAVAGGLAGVALARVALAIVPALVPPAVPRIDTLSMDWPVAIFTCACALAAGVGVSLLPAWEVRRLDLVETLGEDALAPSGSGFRLRGARLRAGVLVAQVAAAAVLLVTGTLLTRSFLAMERQDRGMETTGVLTATLPLPSAGYDAARRAALFETLAARMRAMPGVQSIGFTNVLPLSGSESVRTFEMRARRGSPGATAQVQSAFRVVSPGYFPALGLRLVEGRLLRDDDTATSRHAVVVNRAFARAYLDEPAVGRLIPAGRDETADWEVIGVVENVRGTARDASLPEMIVSYRQWPDGITSGEPALAIRTTGEPMALAPVVRDVLRDLEPDLALGDLRTMDDRVREIVATPRLYSFVVGTFAALALAIAAVGLFGVLSNVVAQRSRELAVRAALGAAPGRLVGMVVRQGLGLVAAGLVIGFLCAGLLGNGMASLLYGVTPQDPLAFVSVAGLLLAAGGIACVVPALRAARLSPMSLLRR